MLPYSIILPRVPQTADGSIMIVIATNAPLDDRNLNRLAARAMMGLGRSGSSESNRSGDYAITFSTAKGVSIKAGGVKYEAKLLIGNESMSPLLQAAIESTEKAIYDSLFKASTINGNGHTIQALPVEATIQILKKHGLLAEDRPN